MDFKEWFVSDNIRLYPWFQFFRYMLFWQANWFLFFQQELTAADAISLFAIYDIGTILLEVPSGYMSDRFGRRITLISSALASVVGCFLLTFGAGFYVFALAQFLLGASDAFASGTDSALLYESLAQEGRSNEVALGELHAFRATFTALAVSAFAGGFLAASTPTWTFLATAVASAIAVLIAFRFRETIQTKSRDHALSVRQQARAICNALRNPVLTWVFMLVVGMYVLGHVPFVFGQALILVTLDSIGLAGEATIVSGSVAAAMMLVSVAASWLAFPMHRILGLGWLLLVALSIQIGLISVLAAVAHPLVIAILLLRMVPNALAKPFVLARVQPFLDDQYRASYWSLNSLVGRIILAASLIAVSITTSIEGPMTHTSLQGILVWYIVAGLALLAVLAAATKFSSVTE